MFNITDYFNVYVRLMFNFIVLNQKEVSIGVEQVKDVTD